MKFNIRDIGPDGLRVERNLADAQVRELLAPAELELSSEPAEAQLDLELTRTEAQPSTVLARGTLHARLGVTCSRCLGSAMVETDEPELHLTFLPQSAEAKGEEELTPDDLDVLTYEDDEIDLAPVVRELMILSIPMAPLCNPECKGLCPTCGVDLNREVCSCSREQPASSWAAALSRIKKTM